jgi:hypothetical protein
MKLSSAVLRFTILFLSSTLVSSARVVKFLFNNGTALPTGEKCNTADNALIDQIFNITTPVRNLRTEERDDPRLLQYVSPTCRRECAGYLIGECRARGCEGVRRRTLEQSQEHDRELQTTTCADDMKDINRRLDALVSTNAVSSGCKAVLLAPRVPTCYDDIVFGVVEQLVLWNGDTDTIIKADVQSGVEICKGTGFNFEVITNPCVDFITYKVTSNLGYNYTSHENTVPYMTFKPNRTLAPTWDWKNDVFGKSNLRDATYTLTVTPDGYVSKMHTLVFRVVNC